MDADKMIHDMGLIRNELKEEVDRLKIEVDILWGAGMDVEDKDELKKIFMDRNESVRKLNEVKNAVDDLDHALAAMVHYKTRRA